MLCYIQLNIAKCIVLPSGSKVGGTFLPHNTLSQEPHERFHTRGLPEEHSPHQASDLKLHMGMRWERGVGGASLAGWQAEEETRENGVAGERVDACG